MLKTNRTYIVLFLVLSFAASALFSMNAGMDMRENGTMSGCVFDQSVTCPMNIQEHANQWKQALAVLQPVRKTTLALLVLVGVLLYSLLRRRQTVAQNADKIPRCILKRREDIIKLYDHLAQALSDGLLNPKHYNLHTVFASSNSYNMKTVWKTIIHSSHD